jgi:NhaP-type Na+/H+ or K+/H+ antiporter
MLPVALSLVGARLRGGTTIFLGWFGPRGIASILFALLVLERSALPGREDILVIVVTTVSLSVLVHGLTAYPGARAYAKRLAPTGEPMAEHGSAHEHPVRLPY